MPEGQSSPAVHQLSVRVYYEDTDAAGLVYYANYLRYAERARTEMLRELGIGSSELMANEGLALVVRRCAADYIKPARLDDVLNVETRILHVGGASLDLEQAVCRGDDVLVRMELKIGCFDLSTGGAARLPKHLRAVFSQTQADRVP